MNFKAIYAHISEEKERLIMEKYYICDLLEKERAKNKSLMRQRKYLVGERNQLSVGECLDQHKIKELEKKNKETLHLLANMVKEYEYLETQLWAEEQKKLYHMGKLADDKIKKLNETEGWTWD